MLGRALSLATVMFLIGCFAPALAPVQAQNLEAGKSPSQIFAGACTACHKSPRGLLRTVPAGSLPGFLREHYTTSSGMASLLSNYLISNGATDTRYGGGQPRPDRGAKSEARSGGEPEQADRHGRRINPPREAAEPPQGGKPDVGQAEPRLRGRNARRLERAGQGPDAAKPAEVQAPALQANQHGRDGRKARHRTGKRGRPAVDEEPGMGAATPEPGNSEAAKPDGVKPDEPQTGQTDAAKDQSAKTEPAQEQKGNQGEPAAAKPPSEGSSAKVEPPKETGSAAPAQRTDPVPPVPPAAPPAASTVAPGATSAAASNAAPEHTSAPAAPPAASAAPQPAAPEGSPVPPISK